MRFLQLFTLLATARVAYSIPSTSEPTGIPSAMPTSPTALPTTSVPTAQPTTSVPTAQPTTSAPTSPTSMPSSMPTSPTSLPTGIPTAFPTPIPTSAPTIYLCDVNILLFDLFGDGWGNSNLFVNIDGDIQNYTLSCGHCDHLAFDDIHCNVSIWMASADADPVTPWENYWVVEVTGQTFVGGYDSYLTIDGGEEASGINLIDYNETIECNECRHPKPKAGPKDGKRGKGGNDDRRKLAKKGPKKPPAFANSKLYDEQSNGWFMASGWNDVCDSENCSPGDTNCSLTVPNIPNALAYPRYYILNEEKTEIIHEGTICSNSRGFEFCENVIPHNGDFVFRVAGIAPDDDSATWEFCGKSGGINQELQFTMKDGACIAGASVTASDVCDGLLSAVVLSGSLLLGGLKSGTFSDVDATVLESDLKLVMPSSGVTIKSWTNTDNGLRVHFSANIESDMSLLYYHTNLDNLVASIQTDLSSSISSGAFKDQLTNALDAYPNTQNDILRGCDSIVLEDLLVYSVGYVVPSNVERSSPVEVVTYPIDETSSKHSHGTIYTVTSVGVYALVTLGFVSLGLVAVAVRMLSRKKFPHEPLPTESVHESA